MFALGDDAFEDLDALFVAFSDARMNLDRVARSEFSDFLFFLGVADQLCDVHDLKSLRKADLKVGCYKSSAYMLQKLSVQSSAVAFPRAAIVPAHRDDSTSRVGDGECVPLRSPSSTRRCAGDRRSAAPPARRDCERRPAGYSAASPRCLR